MAGWGGTSRPRGSPERGRRAEEDLRESVRAQRKSPKTGKMEEVAAAEGVGAPRFPLAGSPWPGPLRPQAAGRAAGMLLRRP